MALLRIIPVWSIAAPVISALVLLRKGKAYSKPNEPPPYYVPFNQNGLLADWIFFSSRGFVADLVSLLKLNAVEDH